jgi:hypothetical protein
MSYTFTVQDIESIVAVIGDFSNKIDNTWSWHLKVPETSQSIVFSIHNEINLSKNLVGSLISVQTQHGYFEMHDCSGFMAFEPDEIIFVRVNDDTASCLTIGRHCTCSLFSNIRMENLNSDFSSLDPSVLLSAMQLSLTEGLLMDIKGR